MLAKIEVRRKSILTRSVLHWFALEINLEQPKHVRYNLYHKNALHCQHEAKLADKTQRFVLTFVTIPRDNITAARRTISADPVAKKSVFV